MTVSALWASATEAKPILGFNDTAQTFAARSGPAQQAGAVVARLPVSWAVTEPIPGLYRWESIDAAVAGLRDHGVVPVFALIAAPEWASGACRAQDGYTCGPARGNTDDYVRFGARLLERYPGALVQSWNEPNILLFGGMSFDHVARLTNALAAAAPGRVIGPAASPADPNSIRYTRQAYALIDRRIPVAVHLYPRSPLVPDGYRSDWRKARKIAGERPLWVTELGYASSSFGARGQARALARTYQYLARNGADVIVVHSLVDAEIEDSPWLSSMGLLRADGSPKPAYRSLRRVAAKGY